MLHLCTLIFQYDIHKNTLKSQYYYPDLIELQNAPLTYSLCKYITIWQYLGISIRFQYLSISQYSRHAIVKAVYQIKTLYYSLVLDEAIFFSNAI